MPARKFLVGGLSLDFFIKTWVAALVFFIPAVWAQTLNGFDLSRATIPTSEIFHGGPPRDGIPSIDDPKFIAVDDVDYLHDDDIVLGLVIGGVARAYPTRILVWHEIVNDVIGDAAVAVTYCPLCGTGMVFDRAVGEDGGVRTFGVSGLLYQSDVLMYDRETESLWSQLAMRAVSGEAVETTLTWLPAEHMTWRAWREKHPQSDVLSADTGYRRDYAGEAYAGYFATDAIMFPVPQTRRELSNKDLVAGLIINGKAKAYPLESLPDGMEIDDEVGGVQLKIHYDAAARHPRIREADGTAVPAVVAFWFAWQAFYPRTDLWTP